MWRLKACPKCGGDMFLSPSEYGWEESCLQCCYTRSDSPFTETPIGEEANPEAPVAGENQ